jgi:hypothetical protein
MSSLSKMGNANLTEAAKHALMTDQIVLFSQFTTKVSSYKLSDGTAAMGVAAGGKIQTGTGHGYQMVIALFDPMSIVLINDLRHPEQQQRFDMSHTPCAVSFNHTGKIVAALTEKGMSSGRLYGTHTCGRRVAFVLSDRHERMGLSACDPGIHNMQ